MSAKAMATMLISPIPQENPANRTGAYWASEAVDKGYCVLTG
jgi:hypothetical protein